MALLGSGSWECPTFSSQQLWCAKGFRPLCRCVQLLHPKPRVCVCAPALCADLSPKRRPSEHVRVTNRRCPAVLLQVCKLGWLSAVETFPLDGSCSKPHKRRDMRSGKQTGQLLEAQDGRMVVTVCWQGSLAGSAVDTLLLQQTPQGGMQLVVLHKAQVQGRGTAEFKEVFRMDV